MADNLSVFQTEVFAIKQAALHLKETGTTGKGIIIHSDSRAALQAINNNFVKSRGVLQAVHELNALSTYNNVVLRWIKAHVGHPGNERADTLAKEGAENPALIANCIPLTANTQVKSELREKTVAFWNEQWQKYPACRQTKHFFPTINKSQSLDYTKCRRNVFSAVVQFITGHNFLNRHQAIVDFGFAEFNAAKCRYCQKQEESTYHMLSECDAHAATRQMIWGRDTLIPPFNISMYQIVEFLRTTNLPSFREILNFTLTKDT